MGSFGRCSPPPPPPPPSRRGQPPSLSLPRPPSHGPPSSTPVCRLQRACHCSAASTSASHFHLFPQQAHSRTQTRRPDGCARSATRCPSWWVATACTCAGSWTASPTRRLWPMTSASARAAKCWRAAWPYARCVLCVLVSVLLLVGFVVSPPSKGETLTLSVSLTLTLPRRAPGVSAREQA
jgi:hypothetical protein